MNETKVSMQGEAAVKVGRPLVETQTCHRKMKSLFERNQSISTKRSRSKSRSLFGRNSNSPQQKLQQNPCPSKKYMYNTPRISDAGWSSLVARRAHNPKVVGSNPAPATNFKN